MRAIASVLVTIVAALGLYAVTVTWILSKPLTVGFIAESFSLKRAYADRARGPRVVIVAGSNGLFSHRCETMEPILGMPCVNASITAELGLAYMLELTVRILRPGDIVLMPLEYPSYENNHAEVQHGLVHPFRLTYDGGSVFTLPATLAIRAVFQFDLRYMIGAAVEMALDAMGVTRRFNTANLTVQGDMRGHTEEKGAVFGALIMQSEFWLKPADKFSINPGARDAIEEFLHWAAQNKIKVIGSLPTTFDDRPVDEALVARLERTYKNAGQDFLTLRNLSQYPRACFYDTQYHLNEPCQIRHSKLVAQALAPRIRASRKPSVRKTLEGTATP